MAGLKSKRRKGTGSNLSVTAPNGARKDTPASPVRPPRKRRVDRRGRLDVLASAFIGELAQHNQNPIVRAVYSNLKPEVDRMLTETVGGANITRKVRRGLDIIEGVQREQQRTVDHAGRGAGQGGGAR